MKGALMWLPVIFRATVLDHWPQPAVIPHIPIGTASEWTVASADGPVLRPRYYSLKVK